jgi:excinuclease ABC subunit B
MSQDLTDYLVEVGIRARYLHSEIKTFERHALIRGLRLGEIDVLVGINLLREGLDLPEVSLVAILDADKEGFLRNYRSLIQTMGRASRNVSGNVLLFADTMTESMEKAITETLRRRELQKAFNAEHGIVPKSVTRKVEEQLEIQDPLAEVTGKNQVKNIPTQEEKSIEELEAEMKAAAARLDFEEAARLRDILRSKN